MRLRLLLAGLLCLLAWPFGSAAAEIFIIGVAPQFEQRKLFAAWKPLIEELHHRTGAGFKFESALTVPEFEKNVARGAYDFIYVNPYHLFKERGRQGYIPLVRDRTPLRGIVVVRKDSPLTDARQLDGHTLAVPSLNALGASMLLSAELARLYGVKLKLVNAKSHTSAYLYVANKLADAAGGVDKTLGEQDPAVQAELRVLFRTRDFPSHPIAAHPRVPEALREQVRSILLEISSIPEGRRLLAEIPMSQAVATSFKDYEVLEGLDLDRYWIDPVPAAGKP